MTGGSFEAISCASTIGIVFVCYVFGNGNQFNVTKATIISAKLHNVPPKWNMPRLIKKVHVSFLENATTLTDLLNIKPYTVIIWHSLVNE